MDIKVYGADEEKHNDEKEGRSVSQMELGVVEPVEVPHRLKVLQEWLGGVGH